MGRVTILMGGLVLFTSCASFGPGAFDDKEDKDPGITTNPDEARIVTSDIDNFWYAFDAATPENDYVIYREEYLRRGSHGLREFARMRIADLRSFVLSIRSHSKYYSSIRSSTLEIRSEEKSIRSVYRRLKDLYPEAVFPPLYFLIGPMNTGGFTDRHGIFIGTEFFGKNSSTPINDLNTWEKSVVQSMDRIPQAVAHELIHYQQRFPTAAVTLMQRAIAEGGADFLSELIAGPDLHELQHRYGNEHEVELWNEFRNEMNGRDLSKWLYNGGEQTATSEENARPADLGYYIGYRICHSYYERSSDKRKAFREILRIRDFDQFFNASGYDRVVTAKQ